MGFPPEDSKLNRQKTSLKAILFMEQTVQLGKLMDNIMPLSFTNLN